MVFNWKHPFILLLSHQLWAGVFGLFLLVIIVLSKQFYPNSAMLPRYDFLLIAAIGFQILLLWLKWEHPKEALVILIFHIVGSGMEWYKTSPAIGSWHYPEFAYVTVLGVPLFSGFMYSSVGSYIARAWRIGQWKFTSYPPIHNTIALVVLIYLNFFLHHHSWDARYALLALATWLYAPCFVHIKINHHLRKIPILLIFCAIATAIWLAENVATYGRIWVYNNQLSEWRPVSPSKWLSWFLLMLLSFVLVSCVHKPQKYIRNQ